jgi:hypothetical protein
VIAFLIIIYEWGVKIFYWYFKKDLFYMKFINDFHGGRNNEEDNTLLPKLISLWSKITSLCKKKKREEIHL